MSSCPSAPNSMLDIQQPGTKEVDAKWKSALLEQVPKHKSAADLVCRLAANADLYPHVASVLSKYAFLCPDPNEDRSKLYAKLRPFKIFDPHYIRIGNDFFFFLKRGDESIHLTYDEYDAKRAQGINPIHSANTVPYLVKKTAPSGVGYLYSANDLPEAEHDSKDKEFLTNYKTMEKRTFYGLHTYGGYHGFFRPDLDEVMTLIGLDLNQDLDRIDRIYVTTDMHPSEKVGECYDSVLDRHKAVTTVYVVFNEETEKKEIEFKNKRRVVENGDLEELESKKIKCLRRSARISNKK